MIFIETNFNIINRSIYGEDVRNDYDLTEYIRYIKRD